MTPKQKLKISPKDKTFYVYYHTNEDGEIFYIGKGKYNRAYVSKYRSEEWCNVVKNCKNGYGVCFFAIGLSDKAARNLEKELIVEGFKVGLPLVNKTLGGQGVSKPRSKKRKQELREKNCKKVYCYQTGKVYYGMSHASEELNVHQSHIGYCCNNKSKQAKGYEFDFLDNVDIEELGVLRKKAINIKKGIKVFCEQNGKVYNSLYAISADLGVNGTHVKKQLDGIISHIKGYSFLYYKKGMDLKKKPFHKLSKIPVLCITNGIVYESLTKASKSLNIDIRKIKEVCENKRESYKGLKFQY